MGLTHGSLFSGIGGMDLGLEWAGFTTLWQVEKEPFCSRILARHWPGAQRFDDVRSAGKHNLAPVDLISGGFPCQDVSIAASHKERGLHGARSGLWFEYRRIVGELLPTWVLIENVPNLRGHGADRVLGDMEEAGYSCWASVVGADTLGAPFQRRRVFILCRRDADGHRDPGDDLGGQRALPPAAERALAQARENWGRWEHELGSGDAGAGCDAGEPPADAYAGGVRELHGIPDWVDRLRALGNAVIPAVPALIGSFVADYERRTAEAGRPR